MEKKQGVSGYRDTQEALENVSAMKSEMDHMKGQTLEDISGLVNQLMKKIQEKRNALAPIVSELRVTRSQAQVKCSTLAPIVSELRVTRSQAQVKCSTLAPIVSELRVTRSQAQVKCSMYFGPCSHHPLLGRDSTLVKCSAFNQESPGSNPPATVSKPCQELGYLSFHSNCSTA